MSVSNPEERWSKNRQKASALKKGKKNDGGAQEEENET